MVHYIRYLKAPKLLRHGSKTAVQALVTVTNDLGDEFYVQELILHAILLDETGSVSPWKGCAWRSGSRALKIDIGSKSGFGTSNSLSLLVSARRSTDPDELSIEHMPEIFAIRARVTSASDDEPVLHVQRRLGTTGGHITVFEEIGESISRHMWDAGVALITYMDRSFQLEGPKTSGSASPPISTIISCPRTGDRTELRVLELGAGCGLVGIWISSMLAHSRVLMTDLPEAMDVLNRNLMQAVPARGSHFAKDILDWSNEVPTQMLGPSFDLIVVSDCTYNCDSIPALVRTLAALVHRSPQARILISMKKRHESEAIFFDLMSRHRFLTIKHDFVALPSRHSAAIGHDLEVVDVYLYQFSEGG